MNVYIWKNEFLWEVIIKSFASEPITGESRDRGVVNTPPVVMAAIVGGTLIGVALVVLPLVVWWCKRKKKKNGECEQVFNVFGLGNVKLMLLVSNIVTSGDSVDKSQHLTE